LQTKLNQVIQVEIELNWRKLN